MPIFKVTSGFNVEAASPDDARDRVRDLFWYHRGVSGFSDLILRAHIYIKQRGTSPAEDALATIARARDFHAANGHYPPGTVEAGQCFDDWAADLAESTLRVKCCL